MPVRNWDFFLAIESDLAETAHFVDFSSKNFGTFSLEFSRIMMAACAEIDTVAKQLCGRLDDDAPRVNIDDYRAILIRKYPRFHANEVQVPAHALLLRPWGAWEPPVVQNPPWWKAYNQIKHDRLAKFEEASLEHALNAVAGLMILVIYERGAPRERRDLAPRPRLLHLKNEPGYLALSAVYELADDRVGGS